MLNVIKVSRQIYDEALIYLQVYFTGLVFTFTYNMISSVFRALGDSKTPLVFLAVSSVLNVILALDINTIIAFIIAVIIFAAPRQLMYIFLATNTAREVFTIGSDWLVAMMIYVFFTGVLFAGDALLKGSGDVRVTVWFAAASAITKIAVPI